MEDAGTSEEDDTDSQDCNIPIDHGHLARNCSIKINGYSTVWECIFSIRTYTAQIVGTEARKDNYRRKILSWIGTCHG